MTLRCTIFTLTYTGINKLKNLFPGKLFCNASRQLQHYYFPHRFPDAIIAVRVYGHPRLSIISALYARYLLYSWLEPNARAHDDIKRKEFGIFEDRDN